MDAASLQNIASSTDIVVVFFGALFQNINTKFIDMNLLQRVLRMLFLVDFCCENPRNMSSVSDVVIRSV
jgi:hypothetical protein